MSSSEKKHPRKSGILPALPRFTGRKLLLLNPATRSNMIHAQAKKGSLRLANSSDYSRLNTGNFLTKALSEADGIVFDQLKIVLLNEALDEPINHLLKASATAKNFLKAEPERFIYAFQASAKKPVSKVFQDNASASWAIQAINALNSRYNGKSIRVAVLDTGIDLKHPDLITSIAGKKTFVDMEPVNDLNGHGTHCAGLISGFRHATRKFRYGVAPNALLYIGKVLSNAGSGTDSSILAGIEWALKNKCRIISLSLGGITEPGEPYSEVYEAVAKEAQKRNCLLIAAAGNESQRSKGIIAPVSHPANCPSILAVGSLGPALEISDFSCGGINENGGQIDIAAPGESIWSTWKNKSYRRESGTSMATPVVAGICALLAEADSTASASRLWMQLTQNAKRLHLPSTDTGAGLAYCRH